jgi:folate-binding protein YgfZ
MARMKWVILIVQHNTMFSPSVYQAARERAASLERTDRGRIVVSGSDRRSYLHGLLTNDVASLAAGQGCYAAYLTPQGRMIADLFVYELGDVVLLTVPREQTAAVLARLDQFVFSEDVQLGDASAAFSTMAVVGPEAAGIVSGLTGIAELELAAWPEHANRRGEFDGHPVIVTRVTDVGEPGYDLHVDVTGVEPLKRRLEEIGVPALNDETAESLRIETGVPRFNRDMDQDTIPLEAGIEPRAISFTKGCYVGQEVIIRVMHRGHGRVARKLVGLLCDGDVVPAAGATVSVGEREVGLVTSSALSGALHQPVALGYLHRDFLAPGTAVSIDGRPAVVHHVPFASDRREI